MVYHRCISTHLEIHVVPGRVVAGDEAAHGRHARLIERGPKLRTLACGPAQRLHRTWFLVTRDVVSGGTPPMSSILKQHTSWNKDAS